ncbi:MAG TPA: bacillithiol system redox-active protein YtxJ [Blastocatellia bacterium]|nr:bacillithiol system redox-active protein YtxJ [Blastocatellia bacterium]
MTKNLKELKTIEDLEGSIRESNERPVLLFKHSTTCPISGRAFRKLQEHIELANGGVGYNLVIVQTARAVSNEVADRLGIRHESPQAILIRNGREVWNASHFDITADAIEEAIRGAMD